MYVDTQTLSDESRVYVFPSTRKFYKEEVPEIRKQVVEFCNSLESVNIGFEFPYDRFLLFFVSEETPLGIELNDQLSAFVQSLENQLNVQLLDKVNVCFKQGDYVQRKEIPEFKKLIKSRSVSGKTIVFDPMINTKLEYESSWESPAAESWLSHLF